MPLSLLILALSAFAIGTTEFVIMGLLPDVAADLGVSIPGAGWLVTGYALGVAIGAPFMALATAKLPRKAALVALMGIFIVGNLLCAVASDYNVLMFARVVTALCHGAFFGIGSVVAAGLVPANKRASAVALMFTGLTLANVLGVPLGTALGQAAGWRSTFFAVTVIGVVEVDEHLERTGHAWVSLDVAELLELPELVGDARERDEADRVADLTHARRVAAGAHRLHDAGQDALLLLRQFSVDVTRWLLGHVVSVRSPTRNVGGR